MAEAICDLWCEGCIVLPLHAAVYCDFFMTTGRRRPCKAGTGCTVRILRHDPPRPDERLRERERARLAAEAQEAAREKARAAAERRKAERTRETQLERIWAAELKRQAWRARQDANKRKGLSGLNPEMKAQRKTLLAWRNKNHITQQAAADMVGVSAKTMHDWEMGRYHARWDALEKVGCKRP